MGLKRVLVFVGLAVVLAFIILWGQVQGLAPGATHDSVAAAVADSGAVTPTMLSTDDVNEREEVALGTVATTIDASSTEPTHRVSGRVVDERRLSVSGARVVFRLSDEASAEAISGEDGYFELLLWLDQNEFRGPCCLLARDGQQRGAAQRILLPKTKAAETLQVDAGILALASANELDVAVRIDGSPAPGAVVSLSLGRTRLAVGEYVADRHGDLKLPPLTAGVLHLTAVWGEREGRARAFLPGQSQVLIALEPRVAVDVQVIDAQSGSGISGAVLTISESYLVPAPLSTDLWGDMPGEYYSSQTRTDQDLKVDSEGRARVEGLFPGGRYQVEARAEGYSGTGGNLGATERFRAEDEFVKIELIPQLQRSVSWPVVAGEVPVPPDNAIIKFRHRTRYWRDRSLPSPGRMKAGTLTIDDFGGQADLIAIAPDGALARLACDREARIGSEISFRRPRSIMVRVLDAKGDPVKNARVTPYSRENNTVNDSVLTDTRGDAVFEGFYGGVVDVLVSAPSVAGYGQNAGGVDLERGDGRLEVVLSRIKPIRARLSLLIDGRAQLPPQFKIRGNGVFELVEELPERGELLLDLTAPLTERPMMIWIDAVGFARATAKFELTDDDDESRVTLELVRGAVLIAEVILPGKDVVSIQPQRFDEQTGTWKVVQSLNTFRALHYPNGPHDRFLFHGLAPGRYRIIDQTSKLASTAVTLLPGELEIRIGLDLTVNEWATGRIELDDPEELPRVRVFIEHADVGEAARWRPGLEPPLGSFAWKGNFGISVPNNREVTIVAWHPWLVPDPNSGSVTLRGGRDGIVLKLVEGDGLILPQSQLDSYSRGFRIARYANGALPEGEALEWHHAVLVDGALRCSLPRGRWTLLVEPRSDFKPLVLNDVVIEGTTELSPALFVKGTTLRVRLLVPEGIVPGVYIRAERLQAPVYDRSIQSSGEAEVLLSGLGPGLYRIAMRSLADYRLFFKQEIVVDGSSDRDLEFDLR